MSVGTINEVLNRDLAKVNEWLIANKLTLNASKTEFMLIGSRQRLSTFDKSPSLSIDDKSIKHVSSTKSLGVHIDENLSWNVHIETIPKKIASGLGALKRCTRFVPQSTLHSVFNALIQPHFDYCSVVWGHCNKTLSVSLPHTNYLKNSFGYQGAVLWNSLPPNLRQAQTLNGFRIGCRQHFS